MPVLFVALRWGGLVRFSAETSPISRFPVSLTARDVPMADQTENIHQQTRLMTASLFPMSVGRSNYSNAVAAPKPRGCLHFRAARLHRSDEALRLVSLCQKHPWAAESAKTLRVPLISRDSTAWAETLWWRCVHGDDGA
ncbi:hypothetical protein B0J13DRAFT_46249 [Dactylonectria estremocensis]|uniref:Uncharacterized protein n=1 Tax=Dactylonectria estremocensis TaxID=1079267 RepID=A0A9P9EU42_9HYPO|nr:hypothetical protein B0J13DRAFT_46249 [Dactylonectria estremocensis]